MSKAFVGTSGWTYDGWRGRFCLENLRKRDCRVRESTTEINGSFCRTPSRYVYRTITMRPSPWQVTARHVYVRGHGLGRRYKDHYSDRTLRAWARMAAAAADRLRLFR